MGVSVIWLLLCSALGHILLVWAQRHPVTYQYRLPKISAICCLKPRRVNIFTRPMSMHSLYNRLLLSWLWLSRITHYLEMKSLVPVLTLKSYNRLTKYCGKEEKLLLPFSTIFSIYLYLHESKLHIHLWNVVVWFIFSSIFANLICPGMGYLKVFQRVPVTSR